MASVVRGPGSAMRASVWRARPPGWACLGLAIAAARVGMPPGNVRHIARTTANLLQRRPYSCPRQRNALLKEYCPMRLRPRALMLLLLAGSLLATLALPPVTTQAWADEFTAAQRAEIVTIIR